MALDPIYTAGIQKAINEKAGQRLLPDGQFGPKSVAALKLLQTKLAVPATGVYDTATKGVLDKFIRTKYLTMDSIIQASNSLAVTPAHIRSVCDVESKGSGFLPDGRPKILFERHHFLIALKKFGVSASQIALLQQKNSDIINAIAGGYVGDEGEWTRFQRAYAIHKDAAIYATSFGLFQIMGFNYATVGYASLDAFYKAMQMSETVHLMAFVEFNKKDRGGVLQRALVARNWPLYAENYNGPNYRKYNYDTNLAKSFARYNDNINAY